MSGASKLDQALGEGETFDDWVARRKPKLTARGEWVSAMVALTFLLGLWWLGSFLLGPS